MNNKKLYDMKVSTVYPLYIAKVQRKGKTKEEVDEIICWLTGLELEEMHKIVNSDITFEEFFKTAPKLNPNRELIKGVICGVRVEDIEDPIVKEVRYLDKLIDELARGKAMDKILRK